MLGYTFHLIDLCSEKETKIDNASTSLISATPLNICGWDELEYERYTELRKLEALLEVKITMVVIPDPTTNNNLYTITSHYPTNNKVDNRRSFIQLNNSIDSEKFTISDKKFSKSFKCAIKRKSNILFLGYQYLSPVQRDNFTNNIFKTAYENSMLIICPLGDRGMQNECVFSWSEFCRQSPLVLVGDILENGPINSYTNVFLTKELQDAPLRAIWTNGSNVSSFDQNNKETMYSGTSQASAIATRRLSSLIKYFPQLLDVLLGDELWKPVPEQDLSYEVRLLNHFGLWVHFQVMDLSRPDPVNVRKKQKDFIMYG